MPSCPGKGSLGWEGRVERSNPDAFIREFFTVDRSPRISNVVAEIVLMMDRRHCIMIYGRESLDACLRQTVSRGQSVFGRT